MESIINFLRGDIKDAILKNMEFLKHNAIEIRLRINSYIVAKSPECSYFIDKKGINKKINEKFYKITKEDIEETVALLTSNSLHAFEKEMQSGYITISGGHRVGIGGDCVYDKDRFKGFRNITSLNIRIAREFVGCSSKYFDYIISDKKEIYNTLIIGPPLSGKTTFIRDLAIYLSDGKNESFPGCDVTIIDERGEICSVYDGIPQMYVGQKTDILSYCMKKEGFIMSIRSLAPKVIISDELGSKDDFETVQYALKSGTNIITTAHAYSLEDLKNNIYLKDIIKNNFFQRIIVLKNSKSPSIVKEIYDVISEKVIFFDSD